MRTRALEFKVGLLIVIAAVLLIGFIIVLGNFAFGSGYTLYVDFDFAGDLKPGAPVKVSGIKVGKVKKVEFMGGNIDPVTGRRVQVRTEVWLEERVRESLRQDAEFYVNTAGVLGEQYLEIVPGGDYERPPLEPGSILVGNSPPRTDLIASRLYEVLDSVSAVLRDDRDVIRNVLANSASAVHELDQLLRDNRESMGALISSANDLAREASVTLNKVNQGLDDPRLITKTIRDADQLLVTANRSLDTLTPAVKTLVDDATRVTGIVTENRVDRAIAVADRAATAATKAGGLIDNVNALVVDVRQGKGTAGALLVREEIYADLREMIRDLKRNPWKFFWKE
jgi:phospholipid/cholesterol/gamma-HCH transport system substrate-binding protein